jgi:quinol monooxygenase YgiN
MSEGKHLDPNMGVIVIVAYRPRPGKEALLLELTKQHVPILRAEGLATGRPVLAMRAADGTIIEVFEWQSAAAIDAAHTNPAVLKLWERYNEACEYIPLNQVKETSDMFAGFAPVDLKL